MLNVNLLLFKKFSRVTFTRPMKLRNDTLDFSGRFLHICTAKS
ncbi:hypothetical protein MuYL_3680 [Mucilaginibacter xinganensis]|uniref:Uncharacterized protein n=1 Tax=Mucilaginibacter xinganensis TaxID=1234841 RepID=A0A223P0C3_9SPHI|nr:hypothetical protein MuYL_3680 [Mucilaginibacter xinganensis]